VKTVNKNGPVVSTGSSLICLMDNKGQIALDFKYQHLSDLHKEKPFAHYSAYVNNKTITQLGIIDDKGNWLIEISPSQF
jgi:hypothetical protein